jgi:transcriptional regulator with XRE-family HTH domain
MRGSERENAVKKLDADLRWFRLAGRKTPERKGWLREIRLAVGITAPELAKRAGISRSEVFRGEEREELRTISLATLARLAEAMDCRLVYAVIPKKGTLADLWLARAWESLFGPDGKKKFQAMLNHEIREGRKQPRLPKEEQETKKVRARKRRIEPQFRPAWLPGDPEENRPDFS